MVASMRKLRQRIYEYTAVFERNEAGRYTIIVPALPGLVTEGRNLEDARRTAADAIRCYIEGLRKARVEVPEEVEIAHMRLRVSV